MERYFVQINGNMWVTHSWSTLGKVQLSNKREDVEETISPSEIKWLKSQFKEVKLFKVALTEVEDFDN